MAELAELWQEHRARLRGIIAKRVRDAGAVDDILQEVFLKAHQGLRAVRSGGSVSAWLYRIAANAIADHYRGQKQWLELPGELAASEPERNYAGELAGCLQPLISALPETYRTALQLSDIEGVKQQEVAKRLGISLSGAKSRVQRGRQLLRRSLLTCCKIELARGGIAGYEPRDRRCRCD